MKKQGIRNLIFDFGGVLIDLNRSRCIHNFEQLGITDVEQLLDLYRQEAFFHDYEVGKIDTATFCQEIRNHSRQEITDKEIEDAWDSFLGIIPKFKLDTLLRLRQHYMVYLLSNTNEAHWKWSMKHAFPYKGFRVEDYFEQIFLSYEMHQAKPDTEIFKTVLAETGIDPMQTLFLDDSQANCQAAESLGIKAHHVQPGEDWTALFEQK